MKYTTIQKLNSQEFKRFTGVHKSTFKMMPQGWQEYDVSQSNAGRPTKLERPEQLLVALQYWREYRTYFHMAQDWEISEATVCRIVHRVETVLMKSGRFQIPGKKHLVKGFGTPNIILIYNHPLSQERIGIEHINRSLNTFRILAGRYRNRCCRYNLRCNLIAALYNHELSLTA